MPSADGAPDPNVQTWVSGERNDAVGAARFRAGRTFRFEAAHHLPGMEPGHRSTRVHGHSYRVDVELAATELRYPGVVVGADELSQLKEYVADRLDHRDLNSVLDRPPTCEAVAEHLAEWITTHMEPDVSARVVAVRVSAGKEVWAEYCVPGVFPRNDDLLPPPG